MRALGWRIYARMDNGFENEKPGRACLSTRAPTDVVAMVESTRAAADFKRPNPLTPFPKSVV